VDGNHEQVRQWRRERALEKTWRNRPELLESAELNAADREFLARLRDLDQRGDLQAEV
jgi:tRNA (guanine37-N1)-methyltransferase